MKNIDDDVVVENWSNSLESYDSDCEFDGGEDKKVQKNISISQAHGHYINFSQYFRLLLLFLLVEWGTLQDIHSKWEKKAEKIFKYWKK